jgi:radical SAM protein with 4Fe4S-binding SPASM domain
LREENPVRAKEVLELLRWNGGGAHGSGTGIGNIDTQGNVHPDQFWQTFTLGNVKHRPFSELWSDKDNEELAALRSRNTRLEGKCAGCRYLKICGGGFRVRALQVHGNMWAPDPACYLKEEEIGGPPAAMDSR